MLIVCLLYGILLAGASASSICPDGEVACLNGACILEYLWCDNEIDCADGSDESSCGDFVTYPDLPEFDRNPITERIRNVTDKSKSPLAVVEAAHYLLSRRKADYGWDDFTARALVGLSFAEKYLPIPEKQKDSMMKRLDLQLLFLLKDGVENLASLALHINALYAMCKDPRDFHGIDLVELLRSKTDKAAKKLDFNLPVVFLTLCIANETKDTDFDKVYKMYSDKRNDRIGVKALTLIAMNCYNRQAGGLHTFAYDVKISEFIHEYENKDKNIDVYSKALICQAYNARGYDTTLLRYELLSEQAEDGSFGDLLGTYSVIPALLNRSLADLQCKTRKYKAKPAKRDLSSSDQIFKPEKQIDYSLWIPTGENAGFHTLRITFDGEKSFYDIMKMAEIRNPMYRFKYDELKGTGKKVYYLAGIPNDIEKGSTWTLYRQIADRISRNSTVNRQKQLDGIDKIYPQDGDNFLFQLEYKML